MSLSGTVLAAETRAGLSLSIYPDSTDIGLTTTGSAASGSFVYVALVGARSTKQSDGTGWPVNVANAYTGVVHPSFVYAFQHDPQPSGPVTNGANETDLAYSQSNAAFPHITVTWPGEINAPVAVSDTIKLQYLSPGVLPYQAINVNAHLAIAIAINGAFFDAPFAGVPLSLDVGEYLNDAANLHSVGTNSTSGYLTSSGSQFATTGHGAVSIALFSWDDPTQTPSFTSGWTHLGTFKDAVTSYCAAIYGKITAPGDDGPYVITATFSSAVNICGLIDIYQQDIVPPSTGPTLYGRYRAA